LLDVVTSPSDLAKYNFFEVSDSAAWDKFVEASSEGTIFASSKYLEASEAQWKAFWIKKGQEVKAGLVFIIDSNGKPSLDELVIYSGLLYQNPQVDQRVSVKTNERYEIAEAAAEFLGKYGVGSIALSTEIADIRPFLWLNYGLPGNPKFRADIRFTSHLNLDSLIQSKTLYDEGTTLFKNLSVLRQRNLREAQKLNAKAYEVGTAGPFVEYYKKLMESQGEHLPEKKLARMQSTISKLLEKKCAKVYFTENSDGEIGYVTIFAIDSKRGYYLFGAGDEAARSRYCGTLNFWYAFHDLYHQGIQEIDLEGINSPNRGKFKLSFGGIIKTYFELHLENSGAD
jgi:hypothetical protein